MDLNQVGMCGAYCVACPWKEKVACKGCQVHRGEMFYGKCDVALCCSSKGNSHCGQCSLLPCEKLMKVFNHPEHGDNGERLANLQNWATGKNIVIEMGSFKKDTAL